MRMPLLSRAGGGTRCVAHGCVRACGLMGAERGCVWSGAAAGERGRAVAEVQGPRCLCGHVRRAAHGRCVHRLGTDSPHPLPSPPLLPRSLVARERRAPMAAAAHTRGSVYCVSVRPLHRGPALRHLVARALRRRALCPPLLSRVVMRCCAEDACHGLPARLLHEPQQWRTAGCGRRAQCWSGEADPSYLWCPCCLPSPSARRPRCPLTPGCYRRDRRPRADADTHTIVHRSRFPPLSRRHGCTRMRGRAHVCACVRAGCCLSLSLCDQHSAPAPMECVRGGGGSPWAAGADVRHWLSAVRAAVLQRLEAPLSRQGERASLCCRVGDARMHRPGLFNGLR